MYYVCDIRDYENIGIKDTSDGSVEYYPMSQISNFIKNGVRVAGVTSNFNLTVLDDDSCYKYYTGDYIGESRYDSLLLTLRDSLVANGTVYRIGKLYHGVLHTLKDRLDVYREPIPVLIGAYTGDKIWLQETDEDYSYKIDNKASLLPFITGTKIDFKRAYLMTETPICAKYEYGYEMDNILEVEGIQCSLHQVQGRSIFIEQLVYAEGDSSVVVLSNTISRRIEDVYKDLQSGAITLCNGELTDKGFKYWGIDGEYDVDMSIILNKRKRVLSRKEKMAETRGVLFEHGYSSVYESGELKTLKVTGSTLEIPEKCRIFDISALSFSPDSLVNHIIVSESCEGMNQDPFGSGMILITAHLANTCELTYKSYNTDVMYWFIRQFNSDDKQLTFDWNNSNKAVCLVGYFAYSKFDYTQITYWLTDGTISLEDLKSCFDFYITYATDKLKRKGMLFGYNVFEQFAERVNRETFIKKYAVFNQDGSYNLSETARKLFSQVKDWTEYKWAGYFRYTTQSDELLLRGWFNCYELLYMICFPENFLFEDAINVDSDIRYALSDTEQIMCKELRKFRDRQIKLLDNLATRNEPEKRWTTVKFKISKKLGIV